MRVLVCGGRDFSDREKVMLTLDAQHRLSPITCIIHGAAKGADALAGEWADAAGVTVEEFAADWSKHGRAAGPNRNAAMPTLGAPDVVIAFPGGIGTANMVKQARKAGVRVMVIE